MNGPYVGDLDAELGKTSTVPMHSRLIDTWFPCPEVDRAVNTPAGSGRSEKALFTWFASRPIAQARAAVLCSLLTDTPENRVDVKNAVLGDKSAIRRLQARVAEQYHGKPPVVLDMFSGRGIIPLEAARAGATAIGTDLSPVATLAGRLLADFALRDWSREPSIAFDADGVTSDEDVTQSDGLTAVGAGEGHLPMEVVGAEPRLLADVRRVLAEVGRRVAREVAPYYPGNPSKGGAVPWAYLWAVTIPCDGCSRRFPMIGSLRLRYPNERLGDAGQSMSVTTEGENWRISLKSGEPVQQPTFASPPGTRGKSARCPFSDCGRVHSLDVVKAKGHAGQYEDAMLLVAETDLLNKQKVFRHPRKDEIEAADAAARAAVRATSKGIYSAIPDETIAEGNSNSIQASVFGYRTYGSLMNPRQALLFATTVRVISEMFTELRGVVSEDYARALASYAAANLPRQLRRSTRGANLSPFGGNASRQSTWVQVGDVFSSQSVMKHQFDYVEAGPALGPGTWASVSTSLVKALEKVLLETDTARLPGRFRRESATALPFRDRTVDALVCDPPYYDMITYADSSDLFFVWLKRALSGVMPDLFGPDLAGVDGLQDKSDEIIVKSKGRRVEGEHRTVKFYESMLAKSFGEARRVLRMTVT